MAVSSLSNQLSYNYTYMYNTSNNTQSAYDSNVSTNPSIAKVGESTDPDVRMEKMMGMKECTTCKDRKYQDGSNDPGVSFKTPGHIDPNVSASAVMSHEQEHVRNESSKASREGREIVSQSVRLDTSVCPECGKSYVSGGETTTVSKSSGDNKKSDYFVNMFKKSMENYFGKEIDVKV